MDYYRIAGNLCGLKFSQIGGFWIFAVNFFTVLSAPRPHSLLAITVRSRGLNFSWLTFSWIATDPRNARKF